MDKVRLDSSPSVYRLSFLNIVLFYFLGFSHKIQRRYIEYPVWKIAGLCCALHRKSVWCGRSRYVGIQNIGRFFFLVSMRVQPVKIRNTVCEREKIEEIRWSD